ncbi:hypothetical protein ACF064_36825 [Streptomyces sp. NPDC015492]|uniref:hypothetical protein n=1 Tax=Streptomyces sp. NPDC015492 TaxID=3364958 RepID=UPI0036FFAAC8
MHDLRHGEGQSNSEAKKLTSDSSPEVSHDASQHETSYQEGQPQLTNALNTLLPSCCQRRRTALACWNEKQQQANRQ